MCVLGLKCNIRSVNYILSVLSDEGHLWRKSFSRHLHIDKDTYVQKHRFNNNRTSSQFAINLCKASDLYLITLNQFSWIIDDIHRHNREKYKVVLQIIFFHDITRPNVFQIKTYLIYSKTYSWFLIWFINKSMNVYYNQDVY